MCRTSLLPKVGTPTCHLFHQPVTFSVVSELFERHPSTSKDNLSIKEARQIPILRISFEACVLSFEPRNLVVGYIFRATVSLRKIRILRVGESFVICVRNIRRIFRNHLSTDKDPSCDQSFEINPSKSLFETQQGSFEPC